MVKGFEANDMACSAYYPGLFSTTDPQALENKFYYEVVNRDGDTVKIPCSPVKFGDDEPADISHTDRLGESTVEIMKRYGYTDDEITEYIEAGIVISEGE